MPVSNTAIKKVEKTRNHWTYFVPGKFDVLSDCDVCVNTKRLFSMHVCLCSMNLLTKHCQE